jgi:predicted short-subunit dehydrogenase-like oxidoreductase (DUF2520 family)
MDKAQKAKRMIVTVIGAGNLGSHLALGLHRAGCHIEQVFSRKRSKAESVGHETGAEPVVHLDEIRDGADLYLVAVADDAVQTVANQLRHTLSSDMFVAHTAGSVHSDVLAAWQHHGVFCPLQTFTSSRPVEWKSVPIILHGSTPEMGETLHDFAHKLTDHEVRLPDQQRAVLHMAAVVANNFSNHMLTLSESIAIDHDLDFNLLKPLIEETVHKVMDASPREVQTGPARRGDEHTIEEHLEILKDRPQIARLYRMISEDIQMWYK